MESELHVAVYASVWTSSQAERWLFRTQRRTDAALRTSLRRRNDLPLQRRLNGRQGNNSGRLVSELLELLVQDGGGGDHERFVLLGNSVLRRTEGYL